MTSVRERTVLSNSLVCLLKSMEGKTTTIELRNENSVTARIVDVDRMMNTTLSGATFTTLDGHVTVYDSFYIQGKNIRFVHIPDEVDIMQAIKGQLGRYQKVRGHQEGNRKTVGRKSRMKQALLKKVQETQAALVQAALAKAKKQAAE